MNKFLTSGNLTKDPEMKRNGDKTVVNFTIATPRQYVKEGQPNADFPNFVAFGKTAEFVHQYFKKGSRIEIEARFQTGSYEDQDGNKKFTSIFVCDHVGFGESKRNSDTGKTSTNSELPVTDNTDNTKNDTPSPEDVNDFTASADLPFSF